MSDQKLTIVATILANKEHTTFLKSELIKLVELTRAEDGCINYTLNQDNENQNLFLIYENWESKAHWEKHIQSDHIKSYRAATENAIAEFLINEMTTIV